MIIYNNCLVYAEGVKRKSRLCMSGSCCVLRIDRKTHSCTF